MNLEANYAGASEHAHIQALVGSGISFNLRAGVSSAAALQPLKVTEKVEQQVRVYGYRR